MRENILFEKMKNAQGEVRDLKEQIMSEIAIPFVLLARITIKDGMAEEYLAIAKEADLAVNKTEPGMLFHNLMLILMMKINLFGLRYIERVKTFYFMQTILQSKAT
jgi:hypothetical protein